LEFAGSTPASRLEEIYTGTFDLNLVCFPYPGYHLFGECTSLQEED
jgi:nitrate reductase assembly molybdenum cofactor insertion protein NarJ